MLDFEQILRESQNVAIVGASQKEEKYGYKIVKMFLEAGYKVYPINPHYERVLGLKCYPDISTLPQKIDILDFVVPPKASLSILENLPKDKIEYLWFQPGSENDEVIKKAKELGYDPIYGFCIMEDGLKRIKGLEGTGN